MSKGEKEMALQGCYCAKPVELLTQETMETIHTRSLEILEETGVVFQWEPALKVLKGAGCHVDFEKQLVKFPRDVVGEALKSCPSTFRVKARDPKYDLEFARNRVYFSTQAAPFMYDLDNGVRRSATIKDIDEIITIQDALEYIHAPFVSVIILSDKPMELTMEWLLAEQIRHTTKSCIGAGFFFAAKWSIEMARAAGIELLGVGTCSPPLTYPADQCDGYMRYAETGWNIMINSGVSSGATGPATLAGTLLLQNAELLAGLILVQVVRPGIGFIYGTESMPMDMRHGHEAIGIEQYMIGAATAQMARFYNIPSFTYASFTGGKLPTDQQVGYEKAMASLLLAQSGVSYIVGGGGIDDEACYSIEQLVIDNEMYGMVARYLEGIKVDEETLAADLIKKVGPIPGNYLREAHTRKLWKQEQYLPTLSYRKSYEEWLKEGSKDVAARAKERAKEILRTHQVPPLPEEVDREIAKILEAAEKEKVKK
jgi:trimethylamine--corrinoid protein Co-methyltransferase